MGPRSTSAAERKRARPTLDGLLLARARRPTRDGRRGRTRRPSFPLAARALAGALVVARRLQRGVAPAPLVGVLAAGRLVASCLASPAPEHRRRRLKSLRRGHGAVLPADDRTAGDLTVDPPGQARDRVRQS